MMSMASRIEQIRKSFVPPMAQTASQWRRALDRQYGAAPHDAIARLGCGGERGA
jgi:hypothetical protein